MGGYLRNLQSPRVQWSSIGCRADAEASHRSSPPHRWRGFYLRQVSSSSQLAAKRVAGGELPMVWWASYSDVYSDCVGDILYFTFTLCSFLISLCYLYCIMLDVFE